jgi:hypothetical protein
VTDIQELERAYDICEPWIEGSRERQPFILTLSSGKQVMLEIPLGAAVDLEKAGFNVAAGNVQPPMPGPGMDTWSEIFERGEGEGWAIGNTDPGKRGRDK